MKVIGITGRKRAGKDTMAGIIKDHAKGEVVTYAFADPVYAMLEKFLNGFPMVPGTGEVDKNAVVYPYGVTMRHMLQTLGTEWGRDCIHPDIWVMKANHFFDMYDSSTNTPEYFVFTDVRFNNEAKFVRDIGGTVIRVVRPWIEPKKPTPITRLVELFTGKKDHRSEAQIDDDLVDLEVINTAEEHPTRANRLLFKNAVLRTIATIDG